MRLYGILSTLVFALALAACASSGRDFDATHATDVQKGVQDKAQIQAWFGTPSQTQSLSGHPAGCSERWTYVHARSTYGGMETHTKTLVVDFDSDGVVCDHAFVQQ